MNTLKSRLSNNRIALYLINLFISFHYFLILFINSTYISTFVSTQILATLYIIGSVIAVIVFLSFPALLKKFGNYITSLVFLTLEIISLIGLAFGTTKLLIVSSFILYLAVSHIIYLNLDIFLEQFTKEENSTGSIRGIFLSMQNVTQIICPLLVGFILFDSNYTDVYFISLIFLLSALITTVLNLHRFKDPSYVHSDMYHMWRHIKENAIVRKVTIAQFMLRFFYAWMVIYIPVYLYEYIGFTWRELGLIFSIMLVPFLLLEFPLGRIADKKIGEKEIMTFGFFLMIITVAVIPYLSAPIIAIWATLLFISRVGAASVEISTESYFFKHVDGSLIDSISFFRMTRPITYILGALVGGVAIKLLGFQGSFFILSLIMVYGFSIALALKDTR